MHLVDMSLYRRILGRSEVCTFAPCPVDCTFGSWGRWSECSTSCGPGGRISRTRAILVHPSLGGSPCNASDLIQIDSCEDAPCPIHCEWASWDEWSKCTKDCNGGITNRHRSEKTTAVFGGKACEGSADEAAHFTCFSIIIYFPNSV